MSKLRFAIITGNHPRHLYFANTLSKADELIGAIIVKRENFVPQAPSYLDREDQKNYLRHFQNRSFAEEKYFGHQKYPKVPIREVDFDKLNTIESASFIQEIKPDLVFVFGSGLIKEPLISQLPINTINLHLGLSPRYRGAATLFWPFYFLEPTYAGSTFHYLKETPDSGDIVHQVVPKLEESDKIHDVACKVVCNSASEAIKLLQIFNLNKKFEIRIQKSTGKNFLESDFHPEHLRVIYNLFNDDIVKQYLTGRLVCKKPKLFNQF